jgi:hypothetical protein
MYKLIAIFLLGLAVQTASAGNRTITLYTEASRAGESMDDFVLRISRKALRATDAYQAEVCGAVTQAAGHYTLTLRTDLSANECTVPLTTSTLATFHTHTATGGRLFGEGDYAHAGYLATRMGVMHQSGRGTERHVRTP